MCSLQYSPGQFIALKTSKVWKEPYLPGIPLIPVWGGAQKWEEGEKRMETPSSAKNTEILESSWKPPKIRILFKGRFPGKLKNYFRPIIPDITWGNTFGGSVWFCCFITQFCGADIPYCSSFIGQKGISIELSPSFLFFSTAPDWNTKFWASRNF